MIVKDKLKSIINKLPYIKSIYQENQQFKKNSCFPAGHYYSTIVSVDEIKKREASIWKNEDVDGILGINLKTENQLDLIKSFYQYYNDIPFTDKKNENGRYYYENEYYSYTDAIVLYSMIRHYKPKQIIEIGSGFSSSVMLDTNEFFFDNQINLTFIEPYTQRLNSILKENDKASTTIIESDVQLISVEVFEKLNAGDILFIDSTHVAKTGSDVNYIIFEILPRLKSGVLIHFHDIFYPFEYLREWVFKGKNWNEDYFLKAFLMYNNEFEIKLFSHYLHKHHSAIFESMPLCYKNGGGNFWLEKK
ncbi:MAG: class I SAM-dependent methyltransferase [Flavobacterium sp.]|uniref:class I SAM-dependent methyltransferase n=1 Tax=Flavobacterium sp. TaxID=239 RepID=UPI0032677BC9